MKDHERVLLGDKFADRELAAMVLSVPFAETTDIQQQPKLVMDTGITRSKS
ncbi:MULTISPECIES: hypothetical protein [unclassified Bradyrhizobium]|uniref:hypothetical protein n=1 Tax=unclassified Bradyrhizobium TaxID=2631580 RepID=UPI001FF723C8|nr:MULTISPECIES: hypothetical protein [unclassified Bradyrhizobium]